MEENPGHLNAHLVESIDETIAALLSREVVDALYLHLQKVYSISRDKVPYKLEILSSTLEKILGVPSSRTICKAIAGTFFGKLGLTFFSNPGLTLREYVEEAKMKLREKGAQM